MKLQIYWFKSPKNNLANGHISETVDTFDPSFAVLLIRDAHCLGF